MANIKLSIVDQSPVHDGKNQADALNDSIKLAKLADELNYHRYWIAEHHSTPAYASSAPEIVIGQIAANTKQIKVGSGGVMLSHYSPYKVAEVFKTLEAFHPGRIDLGVGRAPGGSEASSIALAYPHNPLASDHYPRQLEALTAFIDDYQFANQHPFSDLTTTPMGGSSPALWTLGSSDGSIDLAASMGLGFVLALFIGTHERSADIINRYRKLYRPRTENAPQSGPAIIASAAIAAETKEEAELLASSHTYWKVLAFRHGIREEVKPPEVCLDLMKKLSPSDQAYFHETRDSIITGTPSECRAKLEEQANYYDVDEMMVVAVTHSFEKRCDSYRKLARAFSL
ncbi:LLM class flavin-dependent oxidoreductase [Neptuniibacter marinus]|uniref:LLM class flavin-dependent oxidoreductase n=1 Tax=Neptuniibacter marinus TaxID=1806670 RepID=UPI003B5BA0FD